MASQYALVTTWRLDAPVERIWQALTHPEEWPRWWRYVKSVVPVEPGDAQGVGAVRRYTWTSRLPYELTFDMRTTVMTRPRVIEGVAFGDLNGTGCWHIDAIGGDTNVRYEWTVSTGKGWMNVFAPFLAPAFRWNHNQVMAEGGRGLARYLGASRMTQT
jgi:uncharacterized protein YndB with AHSA1/START domain